MSFNPQVRTRTLARILGPYLIIAAAAMFMRQSTLSAFFSEFMKDEPLVFVSGAFTLLAGLGLLSAHHHWSSLSAVFISLIGLLATGKGAMLMIAPEFGVEATDVVAQQPQALLIAIGADGLLGLWLTIVGWLPRPAQAG
jgi:hypothetical protein